MASISYTTTLATMGDDATTEDANRFASYVEQKLLNEFPGADISVGVDPTASSSQLVVDGVDEEHISHLIQDLWDRGNWW